MSDKKLNRNKNHKNNKPNLDANFVAPDGGWGWLIAFATGFSNVNIKY